MFLNMITAIGRESISLWLEVAPYLLFGIVVAGILHIFLGKEFISRQLGAGGWSSIIKATVFGIPLPVCSCGVIPLATSLRKDGAHKSSVLSFLVSTPTTGVDSIAATYSLLGPLFAVFRFLGSFVAGIAVGFFDYVFEGRLEKNERIPEHGHQRAERGLRVGSFLHYTFVEIPQDLGKWLVIGTLLGGVIAAVIPKEFFLHYLSFPRDFFIALLFGIPLYVCATGSIPIAVSLIAKGFSPGAALVFLIAGPATNAITLSFVRAKLGKKSFYIYLATIISVAVMLGLLFNYLWFTFGSQPRFVTPGGQMIPAVYKQMSAVILAFIILIAMVRTPAGRFRADYEMEVPDIHCSHCKLSLQERLSRISGVRKVRVDVANKKIFIQGKAARSELVKAVIELGYHPQKEESDAAT